VVHQRIRNAGIKEDGESIVQEQGMKMENPLYKNKE
jgi:hypothetical protein